MSGNDLSGSYTPASSSEELILRWLLRTRESQFSHYEKSIYFDRWNFWFGIPVIVVTAIVSASVFATIAKEATAELKYWTMGLSLLAVVFSSLQTFLKFSERAERHRAVGAEYATLRRRLEILHIADIKDLSKIEKIGEDISALSARAPTISKSFFQKRIR